MIEDIISSLMKIFMIGALFLAINIFAWCAIQSKSIKSFQFQFSIFLIIWIVGELTDIIMKKVIAGSILENIVNLVHLTAMVIFAIKIFLRFLESKRKQKKIVENHSDFYINK